MVYTVTVFSPNPSLLERNMFLLVVHRWTISDTIVFVRLFLPEHSLSIAYCPNQMNTFRK